MAENMIITISNFISETITNIDKDNLRKILSNRANKKPERIVSFLKEKENKTQINLSVNSLFGSKISENNGVLREYYYIIMRILKKVYLEEDYNPSEDECDLLLNVIVYSFVKDIYDSAWLNENLISTVEFNIDSFIYQLGSQSILDNIKSKNTIFYRGQTIDCPMSPSIVRDLKQNIVINKTAFDFLIGDKNEKYESHIENSSNFYEKIAFFQHSTNYSPLLDFTTKRLVAVSFALSNSDKINAFNNNDSIVYGIEPKKKDDISNLITGVNVAEDFFNSKEFYIKEINSDSITFFKKYRLSLVKKTSTGTFTTTKETIEFKTFGDIRKNLTPQFKFIDIKTNDRMKYQQGLFLVFYECVSLRGRIYFELNPNFKLYKFTIKKEDKRKILESIYQNEREYDLNHLMNPYLFLTE